MAPRNLDQYETANNREAEGPLKQTTFNGTGNANGMQIGEPVQGNVVADLDDAGWLALTQNMKTAAEQTLSGLRNIWASNYRALNNQHLLGSKYATEKYRGRSQLHRPKTRTAVRKANAGAANALFATSDVVSIEASNAMNERQVASAEINKELINLRLDSKSGRAGVPWFQIAVGAHDDSRLTGICVSKQYWERRERKTNEYEDVPVLDEQTGQPQVDLLGQPMMARQRKMKIVRDRPMIRLFPPELVLRDPGADWLDQAQESSFIGLMHSMTVGDIEAMTSDPQKKTTNMNFRKVDRSTLLSARIGGAATPVTTARETSGTQQRQQISTGVQEFDRIWAIEWFVRYQGCEYVYWTAGSACLLSDVAELESAYPEQKGERPIVIGLAAIEPHKVDPMSMVQSILPLQQEIDDLANMKLDGIKDTLRPLAMVKKGKNIDVKAIQHRSGDSAIYVTDKEDVTFDRPGAIGMEGYQEMNQMNVDFDDATGQFNGGSVSTNRQLNQTVGGMNLLNASANVVGDFDLRVWIETYVEPVLRQMVCLEQYYEDDAVLLAVAGEKAQLYQKYGISEIDSDLIAQDLTVRVNAGIGNADPMIKLDKFIKVSTAAGTLLGGQAQARVKQDAVIDELFGAAGFRDASKRFFYPGDQTDPRITQMQQQLAQMQQQLDEKQAGLDNTIEAKRIDSATQLVATYLDGLVKEELAHTNAINDVKKLGITHAHDQHMSQNQGGTTTGDAPQQTNSEASMQAQGDSVETQLGDFSKQYLSQMLPALMSGAQPQQPAPPASPPQLAAPPPQPQMDPAMGQMMQMMMGLAQQQTQAMALMAQAIDGLKQAQNTPKKAVKGSDGSIMLMPIPQDGAVLQ